MWEETVLSFLVADNKLNWSIVEKSKDHFVCRKLTYLFIKKISVYLKKKS